MNMECEYARSKLSFLPRMELDPAERGEIMQHIAGCDACRAEYQAYVRMFYLVDAQVGITPPREITDGFADSVLERISVVDMVPRLRLSRLAWPIAAVLIVGLVAGLAVWRVRPQERGYAVVSAGPATSRSLVDAIRNDDLSAALCGILRKEQASGKTEEEIPVDLLLEKLRKIRRLLSDERDRALVNRILRKAPQTNCEVDAIMKELRETGLVDAMIQALEQYAKTGATISPEKIALTLESFRNAGI